MLETILRKASYSPTRDITADYLQHIQHPLGENAVVPAVVVQRCIVETDKDFSST